MNVEFAAIEPGQRFELVKPPVTTTQLVQYAGASLDFNRIHYDHPFALEAGLPGVIAHGMLTMGFMAQCATGWAGPAARVRRAGARFVSPVRPGDVVRVSGVVVSKDTPRGELHCELQASVGERKVASGEVTLCWPNPGAGS